MTFAFDLQAATNAIAAVELAVTGVTTAYGYNSNPVEITNTALLPAVVHLPLGPRNAADGVIPGMLTMGASFQLDYRIISRVLLVESKGENYPADEAGASVLWKVIAQAFFTRAAMVSLATAAGAHTAFMQFNDPSYGLLPWPPEPLQLRHYWALEYIHTFTFTG